MGKAETKTGAKTRKKVKPKPGSEDRLAAYRELTAQVRSEIAEYHRVNAFFVVVIGAIAGLAGALEEPNSIIFIIGAVVSLVWLIAHRSAVSWRDWWIEKTAGVEKELWGEESELSVFHAALNRSSGFGWRNLRSYTGVLLDISFTALSILSALGFIAWAIVE